MNFDATVTDYLSCVTRSVTDHLNGVRRELREKVQFRNPRVTITFNDLCHRIDIHHPPEGVGLPREIFDDVNLVDFLKRVRPHVPAVAWPVSVTFELHGFDRAHAFVRARPIGFGAANYHMGDYDLKTERSPLVRRNSFRDEAVGLDEILRGMRLIERICPASNRPIRAWSSVGNLMGHFVHYDNIHARTEGALTIRS